MKIDISKRPEFRGKTEAILAILGMAIMDFRELSGTDLPTSFLNCFWACFQNHKRKNMSILRNFGSWKKQYAPGSAHLQTFTMYGPQSNQMSPCQKALLVRLKLSSSYFWSEMPVCLIGNRLSSSSCSFLLGVQNQSFAALIDFCTWLPSPRIQLTPDSARNPKKSSTKHQTRVDTLQIEKYNSRGQKDLSEYPTQRETETERIQ